LRASVCEIQTPKDLQEKPIEHACTTTATATTTTGAGTATVLQCTEQLHY
jgi:hypothetical protein